MKKSNHIKKVNNFLFLISLMAIYVFSNSIFILLQTSSLRSGLVIGVAFFVFLMVITNRMGYLSIRSKYLYFTILVCSILLFQVLISIAAFGPEYYERSLFSIILLFLLLITSAYFVNLTKDTDDFLFHKYILITYNFMTLLGLVSIILQKMDLVGGKNMLIFVEPSHYALVYLPLVLYKVYTSNKKNKLFIILVTLLISLFVENLTLLAGTIIVFGISYWRYKFKFLFIVSIFTFIIVSFGFNELQYYWDRLNISMQSNNLSVLVWVSGWERAYISFVDSYGVGLGFQRLGYVGELGTALNRIYTILGGRYLNINDGASVAPKFIAETGLLGVVSIIVYLKYLIKILKAFIKERIVDKKTVFFFSAYIMFSVQLFVRGVGYFSPASYLFLASIYWIYKIDLRKI